MLCRTRKSKEPWLSLSELQVRHYPWAEFLNTVPASFSRCNHSFPRGHLESMCLELYLVGNTLLTAEATGRPALLFRLKHGTCKTVGKVRALILTRQLIGDPIPILIPSLSLPGTCAAVRLAARSLDIILGHDIIICERRSSSCSG